MGDERQEGLAVQMATLAQQMRSVASSVEDIKRSVQPFADLDRRLAEMAVRAETVREDVGLLWTRSRAEERSRGELAGAIAEVDRKVDAMKNKATGAMWVLGVCLGVVQTFLVGSIVWVFTHINEGDALNRLQQQRIDVLEQAIGRGGKQ
ncbi:hypothetical protein [Burkholderia ubonensis]|uniref:hypothetical protein n=1 Tax=Burkholderia ubonensis TaxID=101571 RepID=UPI00075B6F3B|nr:hypothetical protein [Burkholderia ubonensis]KWB69220.1 hypothetical protein WL39_07030 [Burkholderia ubonensis]KWB71718.1 hypothetical protein WL38_05080 [Burkholderia ubonensis]KWE64998.1 hypothetical protein WL79_30780 [Burkholderia ubonensis]KWE75307.1 hypothetical protein WL77_05315 [Burkholderia ubonensis]